MGFVGDLTTQSRCDSEPADEAAGAIDPRNALNDLSGKEWLPETKSYFFQKGLGAKHPHAQIERQHPAPFSFQDIQRLVAFFTKRGQRVLDPFAGVGSTAKACALLGRRSVNVELTPRWKELAEMRLETEVEQGASKGHEFLLGDCRDLLPAMEENSYDFVVTSPPYWSILNKAPDHKAIQRARENLALNYSDDERDLGNVESYEAFLGELTSVFQTCGRLMRPKAYMALVVADFRHRSKFYAFHSDLIQRMDGLALNSSHLLRLQGIKILLQNHKSLKPYGYPFAYVENIHHHYILLLRKVKEK